MRTHKLHHSNPHPNSGKVSKQLLTLHGRIDVLDRYLPYCCFQATPFLHGWLNIFKSFRCTLSFATVVVGERDHWHSLVFPCPLPSTVPFPQRAFIWDKIRLVVEEAFVVLGWDIRSPKSSTYARSVEIVHPSIGHSAPGAPLVLLCFPRYSFLLSCCEEFLEYCFSFFL